MEKGVYHVKKNKGDNTGITLCGLSDIGLFL